MGDQSKLTYLATFKVRPAPDGFYVVDCRTDEAGGGRREAGVGKVVAWFASAQDAAGDARARSTRTTRCEES